MDPKAINNLDPKLKETYDRVMGTTTPGTPPAAGTPPPSPLTPSPTLPGTPDAIQQPQASPAAEVPQAAAQPYNANADNLRFQAAIQQPAVAASGAIPVGAAVNAAPGQTSSLLRILYIIAAIVFFVVYTFVWIKIFNLPLPF